MKKSIFVVALGALMLVSCGKMSPEAQKAWDHFKEVSAKLESEEAVEKNFEGVEDFNAAVKEWGEASAALKAYAAEFSEAQADSLNMYAEKCGAVIKNATEMLKAANELEAAANELDEAGEEIDAAAAEVEEAAEE
ncbi:MAG: hypothetical protein IKI16_05220 [Prevotella sp.]|nr:hypothetical protein [Prevotella sp.]